ncbi:MAG: sodium-dependent transporter [Oscillospiraceae bacterium]|nr:sodium-dependent transporter [Oscillospiraceae bacterium]
MNERENWKSSAGFIMAAASSAVGVGNLWRFPYVMGSNGGSWFLIIYVIFIFLLGAPLLLGEFAIGRHTQLSPVGAYAKLQKGSGFIGAAAVIVPFLIMTYFCIIGAWALKYMFSYIFTSEALEFHAYISGTLSLGAFQPILWNTLFLVLTCLGCLFGAAGIEKISKLAAPLFLILLVLIIIRSLTLPGAGAGLKFMFANTDGFSIKAIPVAMGQVFFSLGLASGVMLTYGSYLKKDIKLPGSAVIVAGLDTAAAVLAGVAIFPAVFAMGSEPDAGTGLAFVTLPNMFEVMPLGRAVGTLFFLFVTIAALTSSISLSEACIAFTIDEWKWSRKRSVITICAVLCVLSVPNSLSLTEGTILSGNLPGLHVNLMEAVDYLVSNIFMPLGGLLMCIIIGWFWKPEKAVEEIESTPNYTFKLKKAWCFIMRFLAPILIVVVIISQFT